ncbi:ABC transporter, partial [Pseudomonas simiae]
DFSLLVYPTIFAVSALLIMAALYYRAIDEVVDVL